MPKEVPTPANERARLRALHGFRVLDTPQEEGFDDLTRVASYICQAPTALVSLVDEDRQWFKSAHGLELRETPRDVAFCAYAICEPGRLMVVPDATLDPRFADNALVTGEPRIRFYAGAPLLAADDVALGTLCVIDYVPRELSAEQLDALQALSRQVMAQLELRRSLRRQQQYRRRLEDINAMLREQVVRDPLTGLLNRRGLEQKLAEETSRARRSGEPLALLMVDIDSFKSYNDSFGHPAGDQVLKVMAGLLQAGIRPYDQAARLGGEEFVVILPDTDLEAALALAQRLREAVAGHGWSRRPLTVSIGVASLEDGADGNALVARADAALYAAKGAGRNCVLSAAQLADGMEPAAGDG